MRQITQNIYKFNELSKEAKEKAIAKWYEIEDYPFLTEDLTYSCEDMLVNNNIIKDKLSVYYSLSYSQGDGVCFVGEFQWKKYDVTIKHVGHYYHKNSTTIYIRDKETNIVPLENVRKEFIDLYYSICEELEKQGYSTLEYRMDFDEFNEHCEANNYEFLENGTIY